MSMSRWIFHVQMAATASSGTDQSQKPEARSHQLHSDLPMGDRVPSI